MHIQCAGVRGPRMAPTRVTVLGPLWTFRRHAHLSVARVKGNRDDPIEPEVYNTTKSSSRGQPGGTRFEFEYEEMKLDVGGERGGERWSAQCLLVRVLELPWPSGY